MKRYILFCAISLVTVFSLAQYDLVLMTINDKEILRSEFEYLYNKNSGLHTSNTESLDEYIRLFVNYKLKVAEAESLGLDTTVAFRSELTGYRKQLARTYLTEILPADLNVDKELTQNMVVEGLQIFRYLPQNTSASQLNKAEQQMDSLYCAIKQNPDIDFNALVTTYSDDKNYFRVNRLQVTEEFENVVFSLEKGEVSAPFFTPQGIHIIKLFDKKKDKSRNAVYSNKALLEKLKKECNYVPNQQAIDELMLRGDTDKQLFAIGEQLYFGQDFERFAQDNPYGLKKQFNDFISKSLYDYADSQLETKYPDFRLLMQEYRDGMLLFEVSNREVWNKAFNDKAGLEEYFTLHKKDYYWELPRYKGVVVHCADKKLSKLIKKQLRKIPESDRKNFLEEHYVDTITQGNIIVHEGTFSVGQNDFVDKKIFKVGRFDPSQSHPYTITVGRKVKGPEHYKETQGQAVDDYQTFLESLWILQLREKSKVEINEEVLKTVNNH